MNRQRKSRLHDEKGNRIALSRLAMNGPRAAVTGIMRLAFGYRPVLPWISYDAIAALDDFLGRNSRVLEFGSGMSTLWYAWRAGQVCSVEDSPEWFSLVQQGLQAARLQNVIYRHTATRAEYCRFMSHDEHGFDLVMVDGISRAACVSHSLSLLRPKGILYLDNSDKHSTEAGGDTRDAERLVLDAARVRGGTVTYFTDFAPTQLFVQQGMMLRLP